VPLALKVKAAKVTSVEFVPPLINTAYPDWEEIRRITARSIDGMPPGAQTPHHQKTAGGPARIGDDCGAA
jgi:hypothetical protein